VKTAKAPPAISWIFVDIGGVLLTNGWDHHARRRAVKEFKLDWAEMEVRHRLTFEIHEQGRLSFDEYLDQVVFYEKRHFSKAQFRSFMCSQSKPFPEMIELVSQLKLKYGLRVAVVSNESRELNAYRISEFKLAGLVDAFISSCFVHLRKPDVAIFRMALNIAQTLPRHVVYLENTPMFVQVAEKLGIKSILHTDYKSTSTQLARMGLTNGS
jgi:putative hydrolase of the HAD superfamily